MNKKRGKYAIIIISILCLLTLAGCGGDQSSTQSSNGESSSNLPDKETESQDNSSDYWRPDQAIEVVAPAGAGGGWDMTARTVAKVMEETGIISQGMAVINKVGGGGSVGWAYVADKAGDNHTMFVTSPPILLVPLNGQSELGHRDFTPIATITADYGAFAVRADSPFNTMQDLIESLKEDPQSISIAGGSAPGSMDHIQFVKAVKKAGVDVKQIKYVSAPDGGGMSMLLGGQVEVYSTGMGEVVEQAKAGKIKVLAITAPERLKGDVISEFPTLKEQGIDDEFINWRGFMGPPDMDPRAVEFYEQAFKQMLETDNWKEQRDNFSWNDNYMDSDEFAAFLDQEYQAFEQLMKEIGLNQ